MDVVDTDKESESSGIDKTFINELLGEMKNQFNKSVIYASTADGTSLNANFSISDNSELIETPSKQTGLKLEPIENNSHVTMTSQIVKREESESENENAVLDIIRVEDAKQLVKEESNSVQEGEVEKPRIVLTFRKPSTNDVLKNKTIDEHLGCSRKNLRTKLRFVDNVTLKRSPRRRSRDCNESVLQTAIARKEKSYNETSKPQRLTRQLKTTPKILENLAHAALKLEKSHPDKKSGDSEVEMLEDDEDFDSEKYKKHRHMKISKHSSKRLKTLQGEIVDSNYEQSDLGEMKVNKNSKKLALSQQRLRRRSHRLSSKIKEDATNSDGPGIIDESSAPEQDSIYPVEPVCSPIKLQRISLGACLCTSQPKFYTSSDKDEILYCMAVDSLGDKLIGCNNVVHGKELAMLRPSSRVPYGIFCELHTHRLLCHNCCPKCGLFCTQGRFVQCEAKHHYHRECQLADTESCPHCGSTAPTNDVTLMIHPSRRTAFLPIQRPSPPAKMSCLHTQMKKTDDLSQNRASSPIIVPNLIDINLPRNSFFDNKFDICNLLQALKDGDLEKIALVLGSLGEPLTTPLDDLNGGTVLHYASQHSTLVAVHLLVMAGIQLDLMDKEQNTALVCATLAFKNNVVKYLIKSGASITLKGTDGMTALHVAAKSGNLEACKLIVNASLAKANYINSGDDGGWTPLVWACEHGHFEVVTFLLAKGADALQRDAEQNIALHWAAFSGSADIAEVLLNSESDVNAVNAYGDSPLHIGARQNMYNCILILLARGADASLVNKAGQIAAECAEPLGNCNTAIMLNMHLQALVSSNGCRNNATILTNDITKGRERNPIQCVTYEEDQEKPSNFTYILENCINSDSINIERKIDMLHSCSCKEKCFSFNCVCCNNSLRCWYDEAGVLSRDFNYADPPMIFECNQLCSCNAILCNNRVVQRGLVQRFQLFQSQGKGWGIRTLRKIPKGAFVCEYIGEIIPDTEADSREDDSYLFDLDNRETDSFCIDAKRYGNFARFINHSCEPNLIPIRVFIEHQDLRFPRIAFFANREINAEEELSFDYGEKFWIVKYKSFACCCGALTCKYSEESIVTTLEMHNKRLQEEAV